MDCVKYLYNECRIFQHIFGVAPHKICKTIAIPGRISGLPGANTLEFSMILLFYKYAPCLLSDTGILVALLEVNGFHVAPD